MAQALRIGIINETYTAGATRCARDLVDGIRALGHETRYYPESKDLTKERLLEELVRFRPDVVHLHSYYGEYDYALMAEISNLYPTCFTPHDPRPIGTMAIICWDCEHSSNCIQCPMVSPRRRRTLVLNRFYRERRMKRAVHARCNARLHLAYPSSWIKERFHKTELRRFASVVIPYGIDLGVFHPTRSAREELGWALNEPVILHVAHSQELGAANPRKGLIFLARAFVASVLPQHPTARLIVIGDGQVPNHPRIQGVGSVPHDRLPLYYSAANVFACPTLADNLPYTVLEAMACGKPVIASRVGGIPEEVLHGVTGLLVEKANVSELGDALCDLLNQPERATSMGESGRKRVKEVFSMSEFLRRYESLYRQLALDRPVS
jgi:glycosyltransferase involved in cell wall biosynthesis